MRRSIAYQNDEEAPLINLTPLIDVVFVLLIGCMIATPFINLQKISLAEGKGEIIESSPKNIIISVHKNGKIELNQKIISLNELKTELYFLKTTFPNSSPMLIQDGDSSFRLYQKIKNILETTGFIEFDVLLSSE